MQVNEFTFEETFRIRNISGQIYFIRLKDGVTATDTDGEPVKLNFAEARELIDSGGKALEAILAKRTGEYFKPAVAIADAPKPKRKGRPKKNG